MKKRNITLPVPVVFPGIIPSAVAPDFSDEDETFPKLDIPEIETPAADPPECH